MDNARKTVIDIVNNITNFFQDMFRKPNEAEILGGSFMALAIAVILLIMFKKAWDFGSTSLGNDCALNSSKITGIVLLSTTTM